MASKIEKSSDTMKKNMVRELKNKVHFIRANSQILHDIWKDAYKIVKNSNNKNIRLAGLSLDDVNKMIPRILAGTIEGSCKISQIANILNNSRDLYGECDKMNSCQSDVSSAQQIFIKPEKRYKLIASIGTGGSAEVFKAEDRMLRRIVALKLLDNTNSKFQTTVREFFREAQAAASLSHANIVTVFDFNQIHGKPFIAMEYLEGIDLLHIIQQKKVLKLQQILYILESILKALEYIHAKGLVHRDIKPQNVMVCNSSCVKLMDFGLVVTNNGKNSKERSLRAGTPYYMSPEQILGSNVDHRTDIYSLGATFFHLITRDKPFQKEGLFFQHLFEPVPSIKEFRQDIPDELIHIVEQCMKKKPEDRYQNVQEIANEVRAIKLRLDNPAIFPASLPDECDQIEATFERIEDFARMETETAK